MSVYHLCWNLLEQPSIRMFHFISFAVDIQWFSVIRGLTSLEDVGCDTKGDHERQDEGHHFVCGYSDSEFQIGLFVVSNIMSKEAWLS